MAGLQRQQSTIQGIPLLPLVVSQNHILLGAFRFKHRTLFHTLSVNAATKDPAFVYGGVSSVANSMIGRHLFFFFLTFLHLCVLVSSVADSTFLFLFNIHFFRLCQSILQLQRLRPPFCKVITDHLTKHLRKLCPQIVHFQPTEADLKFHPATYQAWDSCRRTPTRPFSGSGPFITLLTGDCGAVIRNHV